MDEPKNANAEIPPTRDPRDRRKPPEYSNAFSVRFTSEDPAPRIMSGKELRALDHAAINELGIPSAVLMENAAIRASRLITQWLDPPDPADLPTVVIFAGGGNNGGDGLAVARQLSASGYPVAVALAAHADRLAPDTAMNLGALRISRISFASDGDTQAPHAWLHNASPHLVVDAILGTGLSRPPEGKVLHAIEAINRFRESNPRCVVVSLDLPSGLDADTGETPGVCVRADHTITFAALKAGFSAINAQRCLGNLTLVPIGVPAELLDRFGRPLDADPHAPHRHELTRAPRAPHQSTPAGREASP